MNNNEHNNKKYDIDYCKLYLIKYLVCDANKEKTSKLENCKDFLDNYSKCVSKNSPPIKYPFKI